jgi:putative ABC transport system permease protein
MTRFAIRGLLSRKLRTALTALAIVLGVAMISGTFVLTDSIDAAFDKIFTEIRRGSSAVITGKSAFDLSEGSGVSEPTFDESLLERVKALPGVAEAEGSVDSDQTQLIDDEGKAIVFGGAPNLGFSIADPNSPFNPLTLLEGEWPGPNEVVVDKETAGKEDLEVGDTVGVQAEGPVERLRISGIIQFSSGLSIGGATLSGFDLPTAQRLMRKQGRLDEIAVAARPGVSDAELQRQIREILPSGTRVQTGVAQAAEDAADTNEFITFLRGFLLAFGGIALFVGSFVIANSLSITIAQRTRELATLRTLGASRRQVLGSIVVEALVVGVVASVVGLFLGLLLAELLFGLFDAVGFTLPNTGLLFENRTIVVALAAGILVTLLASLRPAVRATRVPPVAAVREGATIPPGRFARFRGIGALLMTAAGFGALSFGLFAAGLDTTEVLIWMGLGALLVFLGTALFSSRLVGPLVGVCAPVARYALVGVTLVFYPAALAVWVLREWFQSSTSGARKAAALAVAALLFVVQVVLLAGVLISLRSLPVFLAVLAIVLAVMAGLWLGLRSLARRRGLDADWPIELTGDSASTRIGESNTRRNTQRTASTAAALMIGLALVTLVATLAAGIVRSFEDAVNRIFVGDFAITAQNNFSAIPIDAADAAATTPGVTAVGNVRTGEALVFGDVEFVTAVNPDAGQVINLEWAEGSQDVFRELGSDGAFVDDGYAEDHDLRLGSPVVVTFPNRTRKRYGIEGIFDPGSGGSPFGAVTISAAEWDAQVPQPRNLYSFLKMRGGPTEANKAALERSLKDFPNAKAQTRDEFIDNQISGLSAILNILYVLLALSIIVSLFGIVNTLVLTVFERTREIGMLRAIGMTRRQIRRMIRHESVITALIGAAIGIVLGIVLAALLIYRVDFIVFAFPTTQLVIFVLAAILVGILAAIFPARRAAKLNPLEAISYE